MRAALPRLSIVAALLALVACGGGGGGGGGGEDPTPSADAPAAAADASTATTDAPAAPSPDESGTAIPAVADAGPAQIGTVDEEVVLDASASTGAVSYRWSYGDGRGQENPVVDPVARVRYLRPGRYKATVTVFGARGDTSTASAVITVVHPPVHAANHSTTVAFAPDHSLIAAASADANGIVVAAFDGDADEPGAAFGAPAHHPTARGPRTVAFWRGRVAVACETDATIDLVGAADGEIIRVPLPLRSRPYGVLSTDEGLFVSLSATGQLAHIRLREDGSRESLELHEAIVDGRALALLPDGRIAVARWRSPDTGAEIAVVDPATGERALWSLAVDPQIASDTEVGGVPSYLNQLLASPDGRSLAIPSLQANITDGLFRNRVPMRHDTALRATISFVDLADGAERFDERHQLDNRGLASAAVWSAHGDFLFVATRGSRTVERYDVLDQSLSGSILNVGFAPEGLALSPDDRWLVVDASLSRALTVFDVGDLTDLPRPLLEIGKVASEPLSTEVLRGKILFNDSFDPRISKDGYMACAHCHLDGLEDHRTWDFTDRGEGLRNTIALTGRAGPGHGPIHWTGNFDEVQDFEHDIRNAFGGRGLMSDADFEADGHDETLGTPKAGVSADLDALAAYVSSLDAHLPSPWVDDDGSLSEAAQRGQALFESEEVGCTECHRGERLTDSRFESPGMPALHDVGTLAEGSGQRLGGELTGIDTPTLRGLWHTAPYLHDGSAATLRDVLRSRNRDDRHGVTSILSAEQIDDLVAYLSSL